MDGWIIISEMMGSGQSGVLVHIILKGRDG